MARTMIDHACELCGAVRKVSPDKLARGIQRMCRKCQGPARAAERRAAMLKRGGPSNVVYAICKECRCIYQKNNDDHGYCGDVCEDKAEARGHSRSHISTKTLNGLWRAPRRGE